MLTNANFVIVQMVNAVEDVNSSVTCAHVLAGVGFCQYFYF